MRIRYALLSGMVLFCMVFTSASGHAAAAKRAKPPMVELGEIIKLLMVDADASSPYPSVVALEKTLPVKWGGKTGSPGVDDARSVGAAKLSKKSGTLYMTAAKKVFFSVDEDTGKKTIEPTMISLFFDAKGVKQIFIQASENTFGKSNSGSDFKVADAVRDVITWLPLCGGAYGGGSIEGHQLS